MKHPPIWLSLALLAIVLGSLYVVHKSGNEPQYSVQNHQIYKDTVTLPTLQPSDATEEEKRSAFTSEHYDYEYQYYDVLLYTGQTFVSKDSSYTIQFNGYEYREGKGYFPGELIVSIDGESREFSLEGSSGPSVQEFTVPLSLGTLHIRPCEAMSSLDHAQAGEAMLMVSLDISTRECPSLAG